MGYNSWEQLGDDLKKSIWDAVDSGDFSSLNQTVSNTIEHAVDSFTGSFRGTRQNQTSYQNGQAQQNQAYNRQSSGAYQTAVSQTLYASGTGAEVGGAVMIALGGLGACCFLLLLFMLWLDPWMPWGMLFIAAALAIGCGAVAGAGGRMIGQIKRFRQYVGILQNREYYEVKTLAQQTGRSVGRVTKDLKRMIRRGWFKQGHLDESGNCLMVSERSYRQYLELMNRTRRQKEEEAARAQDSQRKQQEAARNEEERKRREEERYAHLDPEVREIIQTGNSYVKKVRSLNDEIPGKEVSAKISRMELLLERIFDRVEKHPESAGDMRRLMDYYLPMTVKLLEAYRDMDAQPVQPANVLASKQEIEKTLDTLNGAFEKLLDDLFMDTAWDLSSDISVLNTMLTQDGLTGGKIPSI